MIIYKNTACSVLVLSRIFFFLKVAYNKRDTSKDNGIVRGNSHSIDKQF